MTHRTENNRIFDTDKILMVAIGSLIFSYTFSITNYGLVTVLELPGGITSCAGKFVTGFPWIMVIIYSYHFTMILIGISADLALNRFMTVKRNRGREARLVAWKTSSTTTVNP